MNILIVGAGSIGKVYAYHLAQGGAKISFFVKEKYAEQAREGFYFYPLNQSNHRYEPVQWKDFSVLTTHDEVKAQSFDYVVLAMSSPALRSGWLDDFLTLIPSSTVVSLQPGMLDRDYLIARLPAERLIEGTIHILSYEAPLPGGEENPAGTAFWIPPGTQSAFSGNEKKIDLFLAPFRKANFAVKKVDDSRKLNLIASPALTLFVLALEKCKWSFIILKDNEILKVACAAIPEAVTLQANKANAKRPFFDRFLSPKFFKGLMDFVPRMTPFDFETYVEVHFTKVHDQMLEHLDQLIHYGKEKGLPTAKLESFKAELKPSES